MLKVLSSATGILVAIVVLTVITAQAQEASLCVTAELTDPPRIVFECPNGLVIEAEAGAALDVQAVDSSLQPTVQGLDNGAVLVNLPTNTGPFQIMTPHAIASVRGTVFIVDVGEDETAVFVVEGVVEVTRNDGGDAVELRAGDGVRVSDEKPVVVKRWPEEKVKQILARFGR